MSLERIEAVYTHHSDESQYRRTVAGTFVPSPIRAADELLETLEEQGIIVRGSSLIDAGSGDGRIVATAALRGYKAFGIEMDSALIGSARHTLSALADLFPHAPRIIGGDFTDDRTYQRAGLDFSDFEIVFNYMNNQNPLAWKIRQRSPNNTTFILTDWEPVSPPPPRFHGLELVTKTLIRGYHSFVYKKI